ncbi:MAG: hypothetical protein LBS77_00075 [Desulfovibrio sp.]|jgi:phosphoglycolate phosphatase-like HAD superfamily hydrolase|nr:hypothetical protein [Desulfovibrio sp.]
MNIFAEGTCTSFATYRIDASLQVVLDFFGLPDYFNPVVTTSNSVPKPSPEDVQFFAGRGEPRPQLYFL